MLSENVDGIVQGSAQDNQSGGYTQLKYYQQM